MLGGAAPYISLAAIFFTPVKLVGVVGDDFAQADCALLARHGIDLEGLERVPGKTFFWSGVYSDDMNERTTTATDLNVFADFKPKLPASYRSQGYLLLGNIQPALQRSVRAQMNGVRFVGGDTMNYWIQDFREELLSTIREWDFLLINDSEARMLAVCHNLRVAAERIMEMGPRTLVIKRGEYGAILFRPDGHFIAPGFLLREVFDPTGAGDCFAGGFMGYLAERGIDPSAGAVCYHARQPPGHHGSRMGGFGVGKVGVNPFRQVTGAEVGARYPQI